MSNFSTLLCYYRKKAGYSQEKLGNMLDLGRTTINNYEKAVSEPGLDMVIKIANLFDISVSELLQGNENNLTRSTHEPSVKYETEKVSPKVSPTQNSRSLELEEHIKGKSLKIREVVVPVDERGKAQILFVPATAFAGYLSGFGDPEYIEKLPTMTISGFLGDGHYRGFGVEGDSMETTYNKGEIVICREVPDWNWIRNNECYVIVNTMGIVLKRCINKLNTEGIILCKSDNAFYEPYPIAASEIREVWEVRASFQLGSRAPHDTVLMERRIIELETRLDKLSSNQSST